MKNQIKFLIILVVANLILMVALIIAFVDINHNINRSCGSVMDEAKEKYTNGRWYSKEGIICVDIRSGNTSYVNSVFSHEICHELVWQDFHHFCEVAYE